MNETLKNGTYFKNLPAYFQEQIIQAQIELNTEQELKDYVEKLQAKD